MKFPSPVPELPVRDLKAAGEFYERCMGFKVDWTYEDFLAGISRDNARIFLRRRNEQEQAAQYRVLIWLNLDSPAEVDELYAQWKRACVTITHDLETSPYNLRQFIAADLDGNEFRVFYDLGPES